MKFTDGERETKEKGVTLIDASCNQGVNKDFCTMGFEGWAEEVDVA